MGTYAVGDMVITSEGSIATNTWSLTDIAESEGTLSVVIDSEIIHTIYQCYRKT